MRIVLSLLAVLFAVPALGEPPRVVVDIAPVHALVAQVMEGVAAPDLLLAQDANPHAVQLRPSQARMLARAELVIWVGPALTPWLGRVIAGLDGDGIVLMALPETVLREFGTDHTDHDGDDGDDGGVPGETAETAETAETGHDQGGADPHVWLTPENVRAWIGVFADALAARDPDNAPIYRANAEQARTRIDALTARIEARLAPHRGAAIVTFHDSLGYFADRFGLEIAGSVRAGDAAAPSAAALSALRDVVAERHVVCAFAEPAFDPGLLETVAAGTGLAIAVLDPTGVLQQPGPSHYEATMEALAEGIAGCLDGAEGGVVQ